MIIPHSKSIRLPRFSRRIPFCVDTRMIRWNFPYIESNYKTERELYTWDYRNRLTSVTKQTYNAETGTWENVQIVEYTYDYNNVWIRKTLDSNGDGTADSKSIFIPENYQTVLQLDDTNLTDANAPAITHHYLWTPNAQDKLFADTTADGVLWSLTDHLGSIRDIIQSTESGVITQAHIIYDAYGNIISCKNSEGQTVDNPLLFAYTGKPFDVSTSLQNNINRWYDATVGRWLSIDPIGFDGNDANLYRYVKNNSVDRTDYTGLMEESNVSSENTSYIIRAMEGIYVGNQIVLGGKTAIRIGDTDLFVTGGKPLAKEGMKIPPLESQTSSMIIWKKGQPKKTFRVDFHAINGGKNPQWHYNVDKAGYGHVKGFTNTNHVVSPGAAFTGKSLKIFRYGGRALGVLGVVADGITVYHAQNKPREIAKVIGGASGAAVGSAIGSKIGMKVGAISALAVGNLSPLVGLPEEMITVSVGIGVGNIIGSIVGSIGGLIIGVHVTETVYDLIITPVTPEEWYVLCEE